MLTLGRFPVSVLRQHGSSFDPDAAAWFAAVEAVAGANAFGPDAATRTTNKTAWSNWVVAQKVAASPIAGRSNWQQLTQTDEGFIQPMMGVSAFNVPPLFGGSTFTGFVIGDHAPALGPKGGSGKVLTANRNWNSAPLNDVAAGLWVTGSGGSSSVNRLFGPNGITISTLLLEDTRTRSRSSTLTAAGANYSSSTFPRSAFLSRHQASSYLVHNGSLFTHSVASESDAAAAVTFFASSATEVNSTVRAGLAFYGRSINLEAMNAACAALSGAIVWPT